MLNETEIKLQFPSEGEMQRILLWCERELGPGTLITQRDEYYDTSTESLRHHDLTLRLRTANDKLLIAMKSPRVFLTDAIHDRIELEFTAADRDEVTRAINRYQLRPTAITEKRRWRFVSKEFTILIDQLPFIGSFLEIEGPSVQKINEIVSLLGLPERAAVNKNYSELLEDKLREIGLPLRPNLRATFDEEMRWKQGHR